ncbi:ABC transporter permease [Amycolatopsis sp. CA-230715]|uniref:ABC transporter permease n=1 Tax=Amycolatopsis sp. CA-230715 TaxID=2745196 RepID=UPI001C023FBF|nr:ABC transporter permease [Amycolatopsis sp. CA-230715]QWF84943.1 Glutathione transport system permease protein GsiD [Amycolatopsis sp. CA-230715]
MTASRRLSPGGLVVRRFLRHRLAVASTVVVLAIVVLAVFAGPIAGLAPDATDLGATRQGPSAAHWLGTDTVGRDVLSRLLHAGRVSLVVGVLAALLAVAIGTVLGTIAGYFGRWADGLVMRLADVCMSFPTLVVIIVLAGLIGPSVPALVIAIGLFQWPVCGRLVRGVTLSLREQEYVLASRATGSSPAWLIRKHLVPAVLPPVSVAATLAVAQAIALEATMSFLGLGVQAPTASWGTMLTDAQSLTVIKTMPWLWLPPGLAVAITVLAVNFIGDGLRDAADPRQS